MAAKDLFTVEIEGQDGETVEVDVEVDAGMSVDDVRAYLESNPSLLKTGPPDIRRSVESRLKPLVGDALGRVIETVGPFVPPLVGMGVGATQGMALGAPLGPVGSFAGGVIGAGVGGAMGQTANEFGEVLVRYGTGQEQRAPLAMLENIGSQALAGAEGQVLFGALGAGVSALRSFRHGTAGIAKKAQSLGVDLTAAEQSGSPFLQFLESWGSRAPGGRGTFERFGQKQATQLRLRAVDLAQRTTGRASVGLPEAMEPALYGNRFIQALDDSINAIKKQETDLFAKYLRLANPDSVVDVMPLVGEAQTIAAELPILKSLQSTKLNAILDDILKIDPLHGARKALGLPPGAPLPKGVTISGPPKEVTLGQLRTIRSELGKLAYPAKFEGAAQTDVPTAQARRLYDKITQTLEADAARKGPEVANALAEANQFYKTYLANNINDSSFYASILSNKKNLAEFNAELFNSVNQTMLLDARAVVSPQGWKMIQAQWFDDALSGVWVRGEGGMIGFNGRAFAERVKKDLPVLKTLFDPDTVKNIEDLAQVARQAQRTVYHRDSDWAGLLIGIGQLTGAGYGVWSALTGDIKTSALLAPALPWVFSKMATNPRLSKLLAQAFTPGSNLRQITAEIGKTATRGVLRQFNFPDEASAVEALSASDTPLKVRDPRDTSRHVAVKEAWEGLKELPAGDDILAAQALVNELPDDKRAMFEAAFAQYRNSMPARITVPGMPRIDVVPKSERAPLRMAPVPGTPTAGRMAY